MESLSCMQRAREGEVVVGGRVASFHDPGCSADRTAPHLEKQRLGERVASAVPLDAVDEDQPGAGDGLAPGA